MVYFRTSHCAPFSCLDMARDLQVVMLPWLAFGHLIPFLKLSIALAEAGIRISFISTHENIQRLPKIPLHLESLIEFVEFHLPSVEGLPEGAEATIDINMDEIQYLKVAYDLLSHQFRQFICNKRPDWIIHDYSPYWVAEIAQGFGIPLIMFSVFSSNVHTFLGPVEYLSGEGQKEHRPNWESLTIPPKWITFPSSVAYRPYEAMDIFAGALMPNASKVTDCERMALTVGPCQAVAIRSCKEYEGDYLDLAEKIYRKPVIPIGLLPSIPSSKGEGEIFKWLDPQQKNSVVYVGFGSEVKLSREHVYEIAHGLEQAKLPFVWALRKPTWAVNEEDALPSGFKEKTSQSGMVIMGWVPQLEILAHPSIGGSLFHSGWGSIIETLLHGHTLVVLPLVVDQGLNARLLVEKGLAIEVDRKDGGRFYGIDVAKALRKAMVDAEGEKVRLRCREIRVVFGDDKLHSCHYMGGFVRYLKGNKSLDS